MQQEVEDDGYMGILDMEHPGKDEWTDELEEYIDDVVEEMKSMSLNGGGPSRDTGEGKRSRSTGGI